MTFKLYWDSLPPYPGDSKLRHFPLGTSGDGLGVTEPAFQAIWNSILTFLASALTQESVIKLLQQHTTDSSTTDLSPIPKSVAMNLRDITAQSDSNEHSPENIPTTFAKSVNALPQPPFSRGYYETKEGFIHQVVLLGMLPGRLVICKDQHDTTIFLHASLIHANPTI